MSRKKEKKTKPTSSSPSFKSHPSMAWLPAFFAGLLLGLFVHMIPGMDHILERARDAQSMNDSQLTEERPVMWRPQRSQRYSR